jgi:hypothetical protein
MSGEMPVVMSLSRSGFGGRAWLCCFIGWGRSGLEGRVWSHCLSDWSRSGFEGGV